MDMSHLPGVYFWLSDNDDPNAKGHMVKIGRAIDLEKRAKSIQTSCPHKLLQLWGLWEWDVDYVESERRLHEDFKQFHHHGEWFCFPTFYWKMMTEHSELMLPNCQFELIIDNGTPDRIYYGRIPPNQYEWALAEGVRRLKAIAA